MLGLEQRVAVVGRTRGVEAIAAGLGPHRGHKVLRPWCARITGRCEVHGLGREFLSPQRDYADANRRGTRGVVLWYVLEHGDVYEAAEWQNAVAPERYFVKVGDDGRVVRVGREEVDAWLGRE